MYVYSHSSRPDVSQPISDTSQLSTAALVCLKYLASRNIYYLELFILFLDPAYCQSDIIARQYVVIN